ncbi:MAG: prefoldin subunit alpha [Candidatus Altiarchaeota archaeon]|nr:prefoldin subunit alpha [Candidatus Altiarchaeota archaeon]
MTEKKEADLQAALVQFEAGKKQLEALIKQGRMMEGALAETNATIETLENLKTAKKGDEILVPIGSDCLISASLKDAGSVIFGVGAKVSVDKKAEDAIKVLKERAAELERALSQAQQGIISLNGQLEELNHRAQHLMGGAHTGHDHD